MIPSFLKRWRVQAAERAKRATERGERQTTLDEFND